MYPYNYDDLQHHYDPSSERCGLGYECEQMEKRIKEEQEAREKENKK